MPLLRLSIAIASGFAAIEAVVLLSAFFASVGAPPGYYEYFGREGTHLALGLWAALAFTLPMLLASGLLSWLLGRLFKLGSRSQKAFFAAGAIVCFASYIYAAASNNGDAPSLSTALWQQIASYWPNALWQIPSGPWASWLGLGVGLALASSTTSQRPGAEA